MLHTTLAIHYGSEYASREVRRLLNSSRGGGDEDDCEISCDFTITLNAGSFATADPPPASPSDQLSGDEGIELDSDSRRVSLDQPSLHIRETYDPEGVFAKLFTEDGDLDLEFIKSRIKGRRLEEVLTWVDVDHYNLLEKAIVYNNRVLVKMLLACDSKVRTFGLTASNFEDTIQHFKGSVHLAAFLGCVDIVQELLDHNSSLSVLRGPVRIQSVAGPPNDLFRIIGYSEFSRNPRLTFQMKWLRNHPNERPVHYAICGGYPLIMKMLMSYDELDEIDEDEMESEMLTYISSASADKDAILTNLIRQAASCASYSCLSALLEETPDAMYIRDQRGWLVISSGLSHGTQFLRFLMEHGFAVKLLNNIDGRNSVNALHVFYSSLSKADGAVSKFTDVYDVTECLVDLGVSTNMETTAFRSHEVSDTVVHVLMDHVNLIVSSVAYDENFPHDTPLGDDIQQVYDESVRDAIYLLLENGFDLEKHCNSLLKRLFMNRNFIKRYNRSKQEPRLVQGNYGLRNVFNISKLLLGSGGIALSPGKREVTPSLCLIDSLREDAGILSVLGDRRATQTFNSCLKILFTNGDSPNTYPFSSKEDSYLANGLVHLCDVYIDFLGRCRDATSIKPTLLNVKDAIGVLVDSGAHHSCFMNVRGSFLKHGVFDGFRNLFQVIHRQICNADQSLNSSRLKAISELSTCLVQRGLEPVLHEYVFRKSHLPMTNTHVEVTMLGQVLLLGLHCSADSHMFPQGPDLLLTPEFKACADMFMNNANHATYYICLNHVLAMATETSVFGREADRTTFCNTLMTLSQNVRSLKYLARIIIRENVQPNLRSGFRYLPLPSKLIEFVVD